MVAVFMLPFSRLPFFCTLHPIEAEKDIFHAGEVMVVREEVKPIVNAPTVWAGRVYGLDMNVFQWARLMASSALKDQPQKKVQFLVETKPPFI